MPSSKKRKYTVLDFAEEMLAEAEKPLLYQEIWEKGADTEAAQKLGLKTKTPDRTVGSRLFIDVRDNPKSKFIKVGSNPARFFLARRKAELSETIIRELAEAEDEKPINEARYHERQLHPLVSYFAYTNTDFNKGRPIYTKTIFHEHTHKTGLNEWVHPDMVGFYIPIGDWNSHLLEFNRITDSKAILLYSFELKKRIDRGNYRASFFQAVSNSSWAHEGYLVTAQLKGDDDLYSELERLSTAFGIGIILLDLGDLDASEVLFPARRRDALDWELMNKLCEQNPDFESFLDDVTKDYRVSTIHREQYDLIETDMDQLLKKLRS
jgi:hypothetical protein